MEISSTAHREFDWYELIPGSTDLQQGDLLDNFPIVVLPPSLADISDENDSISLDDEIRVQRFNVIVATQSCDLVDPDDEQEVIVLPRYDYLPLSENWGSIRGENGWGNLVRGRVVRAHLISNCDIPNHIFDYQVVDLQTIFSTSYGVLRRVAENHAERIRLLPPYREHFAQAFGRQFTRIGLPLDLPNQYPY